jgi:peptidoglycan/LPS O-acetylase OafA/YrhL
MKPPLKDTSASVYLDALRGIAALLVAFGHVRLMLITDARDLKHLTLLAKFFYFITNLGSSAVMIFFVLSGFLVGSSMVNPPYCVQGITHFRNSFSCVRGMKDGAAA